MKQVKLASTIMLARDNNGTLEVLLLKRNKALAFAGGLWVFPGGKIDLHEIEESKNELEAARLAAIRETKEEANVDIEFDNPIFFRHWTTPVNEPRRYATYFFFGSVNHAASEVTVDDSEIKKHLWVNPQIALDKVNARELAMMPPTIMSLQLIRKCKSIAEVRERLQGEEPIFTLPVLRPEGSKMVCLYEGDAGYDSGNAEMIGARHRLILDMATGDFVFEFSDCTIKSINGGMHL